MKTFTPTTEKEMIDTLTGIFEGGSYCALADSPTDIRGGLSFGKHQVSEIQGTLLTLLKNYVTKPGAGEASVATLNSHIALFNSAGTRYTGTTAQRDAFKRALKAACTDPVMQKVQDEYFDNVYYTPAMRNAVDFGIQTALGRSMFYDIAIQAGPKRLTFYSAALSRWTAENPGTAPDEKTFLRYVNAARRSAMRKSTSRDYQASVYRPDEYDKLLEQGNLNLTSDFLFRGCSIKGLPSKESIQS
jgi:chitosanase